MEMQIQTHRMGLNPFLTFYIDAMLIIDANANANVECEHTLNQNRVKNPADTDQIQKYLCWSNSRYTPSNLVCEVCVKTGCPWTE